MCNFHRAKYLYKIFRNDVNKNNLKNTCRTYKNTIKKYHNEYKNNSINKLRKLRKSDPRKYWKILHSVKDQPNLRQILMNYITLKKNKYKLPRKLPRKY